MKNKKLIYAMILLIISLAGAYMYSGNSLTPNEVTDWVRDYNNGLRAKTTSSPFVFDLQYLPPQVLAMQRMDPEKVDKARFNREMLEVSDLKQFHLSIKPENSPFDLVSYGTSDEEEKDARRYFLSYTLQQHITLEAEGNTYPCVLYHFESLANYPEGKKLILGFDMADDLKQARLVIDHPFFGERISIPIENKNLPKLSI